METSCACINWCRAEPQPITDKHHKNCTAYDKTIRVVKITLNGVSLIDSDISGALSALADGDDYAYQIEIKQILQRDYEALPEFDGF